MAKKIILIHCASKIPDWRNAIIVARVPSQAKRATAFAGRLRLGIAGRLSYLIIVIIEQNKKRNKYIQENNTSSSHSW
jgi:hypothetical protein